MEACGQDGRGPTWAVAPTRRRSVSEGKSKLTKNTNKWYKTAKVCS
jgi:hypothetical protein